MKNLFLTLLLISQTVMSQTTKPNIGLTDRLMNKFVLCDRSVKESMAALYEEADVARYNEEYDKFVACSKLANEKVINLVLTKKMTCKVAAKALLNLGLSCQVAENVNDCSNELITICNEYLIQHTSSN